MADANDTTAGRPQYGMDQLKKEFGDRWELTSVWRTAASGPDRRRVFAVRNDDGKTLSADSHAAMSAAIRREESGS